jgi:serine/threonine-protein kinase
VDAAVAEARLGQTIDRYRLEAVLGAGGFGAVYRARHLVMDRPVALKLLHAGLARSDSVRERFLREAQILARLHHPNVVGVHDCGITPDGEVFLAMELLSGEDLATRLHRLGTMDPATTLAVIDAVLEGLGVAHAAGIVHRDLKPANVFLAREGTLERPKVVDFGISKAGDRDRLTRTGALLGTPVYMAPETFVHGTSAVDARADLYAVGVMLFEMLSGRLPYDAPSYEGLVVKMATEPPPPLASVASVSAELAAVVDRALRRDPSARFADAASMRAALDAVRERNATGPLAHAGTMMAPSLPPAAPAFRGPTAPATPATSAPTASASWPGAPSAPTPSHATPSHAAPSHAAPSYAAPSHAAPTPSFAAPPPSHEPPSYAAPTPSYAGPPPSHAVPTPSAPMPSHSVPSPSHPSTPAGAWGGSAVTPSWPAGGPGGAPVAAKASSRPPWGWIALALVVPTLLLGTIAIFVGTCSGGAPSGLAAAPTVGVSDVVAPTIVTPPSSAMPAIAPTAGSEPKPPMPGEPGFVSPAASGAPPSSQTSAPSSPTLVVPPAAPPSAVVPPAAPPSAVVPTPTVPTPTVPTPTFRRDVRMREPTVLAAVDPVAVDDLYTLFESRRGAIQRCRGPEDQVAHVSLHYHQGRISLARSNPNVDGSDTEAARCVANALRGGAPLARGNGIVSIAVELAADGE